MPANVIISVDETARFADVVARLRAAGLAVQKTLATSGVVTGTIAESELAKLERIPGVLAVEEDRPIDIGPPGHEPA
jgi:hypothetical protein